MKYFLDSADLDLFGKWKRAMQDSLKGITINRTMLNDNELIREFGLEAINRFPSWEIDILIEIINTDTIHILKELYDLAAFTNIRFIAKIPVYDNMYYNVKEAKNLGLLIAGTDVYDIIQVNQAIAMDFRYTMVYYHKNPNKTLMDRAYELREKSFTDLELVGASIRDKQEVADAIECGMDYCTIKPEVLSTILRRD